jgi:hypothetical protein
MSLQPTFSTPAEAIGFIDTCLLQNDADKLYSAFTVETTDLWKDPLIQHLREIQKNETLEHVFLEDGKISSFPEHESILNLGGHSLRTHHLNIKLVKSANGWILEYIYMCR